MIKQWLQEVYNPSNENELKLGLHQIAQEITLSALHRTDFFSKAAFYGGTALRVFHALPRFSEDLDFTLLEKNKKFRLKPYFNVIQEEFGAYGLEVNFKQKIKSIETNIESAFLKSESIINTLESDIKLPEGDKTIRVKIKIEVDVFPPLGFQTEEKLLLRPFPCYIKCLTLSDLFAGKLHALLYRKWKTRVKGRDWYDLVWYVQKGVPLNSKHFYQRALENGEWDSEKPFDKQILLTLIKNKIETTNIEAAKIDVIRFIQNEDEIKIWSKDFFRDVIDQMKII